MTRVLTNKVPITVLEWDVCGKYLLIADLSGNVQIWVPKDNIISDWVQLYAVRFAGENIIHAVFFHNGRKLVLQSDKKDIANYMEKFQRVKFTPSVRQFGGVPSDGVLVITATGLLGVFIIPSESMNVPSSTANQPLPQLPYILPTVTRSLGHTRNYYSTADICYGKSI